MKDILLWDPRFPGRHPQHLSVHDTLASAAVRAGVATPVNPADLAALNSGQALDPSTPTEIVVEDGFAKRMRRVIVPVSVAAIAVSLGVGASTGAPVPFVPDPTPTPTPTPTPAATIITPGSAWMGATTITTATPDIATHYGAGSGFQPSPPTESKTPYGSAIYTAYGYQMAAGFSWREYCEYVGDDNFVGLIWGAVGADPVNGRLDYVDFYFEDNTPVRLTELQWDSAVGAFGIRVNLRAPANKNGVARWYARCVPVNGMERLLSGTVWLNSRPSGSGYIDRAQRAVYVDPDNGTNESANSSRGSAAAPYRTIEYAMTYMAPSGTDQNPNSRAATKDGGIIYLVGPSHKLDGDRFLDASPYTPRAGSAAQVLPFDVMPAPGTSGTVKVTRTMRQAPAGTNQIHNSCVAKFIGTLDATTRVLTVTEMLYGSLMQGVLIISGSGINRQTLYKQITSTEPDGKMGLRGTYMTSANNGGTNYGPAMFTAVSVISMSAKHVNWRNLQFDTSKITTITNSSSFASMFFYNCNFSDPAGKDSNGGLDANGLPSIAYPFPGAVANTFASTKTATFGVPKDVGFINCTYDCWTLAGATKYVNTIGNVSWDAICDDRDSTTREDFAIFNFRASKNYSAKTRQTVADYLTVDTVSAPGTNPTVVTFKVGPGYNNMADMNPSDVGILAITGAGVGKIDTWANTNKVDARASGFVYSTTSVGTTAEKTTLTVTGAPTTGRIQAGMLIFTATGEFGTENYIVEQLTTTEPNGDYGKRGTYRLSSPAVSTATSLTLTTAGSGTSSGPASGAGATDCVGAVHTATIGGDLATIGLAQGDRVRLYVTLHGDAFQVAQNQVIDQKFSRRNWIVNGYYVSGVDLQVVLAQSGSASGGLAQATGTTINFQTARTLYTGSCVKVSDTSWAFIAPGAPADTGTASTGPFNLYKPFTGGDFTTYTAVTIGKPWNDVALVNAYFHKRVAEVGDNYGYPIGSFNDNQGQIQQGIRNFGYLCCTILGTNKTGNQAYTFVNTNGGFGVEGFSWQGCVVESMNSTSPIPASSLLLDRNVFRTPPATTAIHAAATNYSNVAPTFDYMTMKPTAYSGQTVTAEIAAAAPFDINGNPRRVGDPLGALARSA